ncbi:FAS1 domain-containing protein [Xylariaceae sp. AK1471]|nr:FAS1 domain-containing protein [Xylariaceae sp. AK1471]
MQFKQFFILALASTAAAQNTQSLSDALQSQNSSLSSLNSLLQQNPQFIQRLNNAQNVTILAPNNDAVNALTNNPDTGNLFSQPGYLEALLSYHVLNGTYYASNISNTSQFIPTLLTNQSFTNVTGGQRVEAVSNNNNVTFYSASKQNVTVETPNVNFTGGTIHIVNGILAIPQNVTDTLSNANLTAASGAIAAADLTNDLTGARDITIFAPNNEAFNAIGSTISNLTTDQLKSIIGYHVVNGTVAYSTDLGNTTLTTESGRDITIRVIDGQVFANLARVTVPDILVDNGVVHVIDQVLNPDNTSGTPNPSETSATPAFTSASSGTSGIPFTSGVTTPTTTFPAATSAGGGGQSSSSSSGLAMPMKTGAVGAAALFGGAAMLANF